MGLGFRGYLGPHGPWIFRDCERFVWGVILWQLPIWVDFVKRVLGFGLRVVFALWGCMGRIRA